VPDIAVNPYALAACVVVNVVLGFAWYGPLFGVAWMREMGLATDFQPAAGLLRRSMLLMVIGAALTAVVLALAIGVIRPSTWQAGSDAADYVYGLSAAALAWIGFHVPMLLGGVAWENRSWKLFAINAGYHLVALMSAGLILAYWR
jgi:hypothetical protein